MPEVVIQVDNISKRYQLGEISTGTLSRDLGRWWAGVRGKEDPYTKIGDVQSRASRGGNDLVWALKEVSFEVGKGEILGIVGRNGAGKSTLLKILSRVTKPTSGRIRIKGRIASLLEVGTGFHPELTGRENIFLNGAIMGMRKNEIRQKLDEIIGFSGVERYIDTPVKRYSSGMHVRLAFAVAAHLDPEILVVDEVLAVGDAEFQKKCLGKMKDVSTKEGRTVLFVSHDMNAVSTLTRKAILMDCGQLAYMGSTPEAIHIYLSRYSRANLVYRASPSPAAPKVTRVALRTSLPDNHHICRQPLEVEIDLHTPFPLKGASISFQIVNNRDQPVCHLWTFDSERPMCREAGHYSLACLIPVSRLYMGDYTLKIYFSGPPGGDMYEILEYLCPFTVEMLEQYREFRWMPGTCAYMEEAEWTVEKAGNQTTPV